MKIDKIKKITGFTMMEILLVMVIISILFFMAANYMQQRLRDERINRTVIQMQQVINGALNYYAEKKDWPVVPGTWTSSSFLQDAGYITADTYNGPWPKSPWWAHPRSSYILGMDAEKKKLIIFTYIGVGNQAVINSQILAGKIPSAQSCSNPNADCYFTVTIPIPGQNLINATGVHYIGMVHSGACIKAPLCPSSSMEPMIMVIPSSVFGITKQPTGSAPDCTENNLYGCSFNSFPITAYVGYATALTAALTTSGQQISPIQCGTTATQQTCVSDSGNTPITGNAGDRYWRVCIGIDTSNGRVSPTTNIWGQLTGTVLVFTRCSPTTENNKNSGFNVYQ
jgi:prepilin-type N-terminal cleavage/methylation domain-containing protein